MDTQADGPDAQADGPDAQADLSYRSVYNVFLGVFLQKLSSSIAPSLWC